MEKKLYKLEEGKIFDGVCAGVAEFFGLDVTLVRIIWAIAAFAGSTGLIAYLVCMILMPRKPGSF